jgi:hypothetical protein
VVGLSSLDDRFDAFHRFAVACEARDDVIQAVAAGEFI